jgi:hypothetical protein
MQIRVYFPFFPYPFTEAAFQVVFNQLHDLVDLGHEVELCVWKDTTEDIEQKLARSEFMPWNHKVRITSLIPKGTLPSDFEDPRVLRVLKSLFSPLASPESYHYPPEISVRHLPPVDLSIFHYSFCYSWLRARNFAPTKKLVVQFHNLEHELFNERAMASNPLAAWVHEKNAYKLFLHEIEIFSLVDEIWHISPIDLERYKIQIQRFSETPETRSAQLRLVTPTMREELRDFRVREWAKSEAKLSDKMRLGFIGSLAHGPNASSAEWILKNLCPILKSQGFSGELLFAGRANNPRVLKMAEAYPFVKLLGFLPDAETFWKSLSYLLVPHIEGSGMRVKILDALVSGVPVICNSAAAERLHPQLQQSRGLMVTNNPEEWAQVALQKKAFEDRSLLSKQLTPAGVSKEVIFDFLKSLRL